MARACGLKHASVRQYFEVSAAIMRSRRLAFCPQLGDSRHRATPTVSGIRRRRSVASARASASPRGRSLDQDIGTSIRFQGERLAFIRTPKIVTLYRTRRETGSRPLRADHPARWRRVFLPAGHPCVIHRRVACARKCDEQDAFEFLDIQMQSISCGRSSDRAAGIGAIHRTGGGSHGVRGSGRRDLRAAGDSRVDAGFFDSRHLAGWTGWFGSAEDAAHPASELACARVIHARRIRVCRAVSARRRKRLHYEA